MDGASLTLEQVVAVAYGEPGAYYAVLEDGKVNRAACDVALGVGIRTVKGDQVGYGFTQQLDEAAMRAAAATAWPTVAATPIMIAPISAVAVPAWRGNFATVPAWAIGWIRP